MRVIVGCEFSQVVTKAFRARGHEAYSCDLLPTEGNPEWHFQEDIFAVLSRNKFDLGIFHPVCRYLSVSGMHWTTRGLRDPQLTEDALEFVRMLMDAPIPRICIENPVSIISTRIRTPDQIVQPWMFGHDASKKTCLWLKNLPKLTPTNIITKGRYANQTASGQNKLGPSPTRAHERSRTYSGLAEAMATQWGIERIEGK